jgi:hypothetical protein
MIASNKRLDDILIKEEYEKIEKYLREININKKARLKIIEGIKLPEDLILSLSAGIPLILGVIYDYMDIIHASIASIIYVTPLFFKIWNVRRAIAYYSPLTGSIYYKRKSSEKKINGLLNTFYSSNIKIKEKGVIGLEISGDHIVLYPVYIDKNNNNIEKIISKAVIDAILAHEISHTIVGGSDIKASALGFLLYYKINKLFKHKKARKIVRKNIKRCVEYVINNKKYNKYSIGECYAIIDLYRNNFSIDINKEIEKLRYMNDKDIIAEIKDYAFNYLKKFKHMKDKDIINEIRDYTPNYSKLKYLKIFFKLIYI